LLLSVLEIDIVLREQGVDLHPCLIAENDANFILREPARTVAIHGKRLQREAPGVLTVCGDLRSEIVRNGEGQLHGLRIALVKIVPTVEGFSTSGMIAKGAGK